MTWNFLPTEEQETTTTLIQLNNDRVTRIDIDSSYRPSMCDTCDYGEAFIQEITLTFEDHGVKEYRFENSFEYAFNEARMIFFLTNNIDQFKEMTFDEFDRMFEKLSEPDLYGYKVSPIMKKLKGDL